MQTTGGEWIDDISLDPAFDCDNLTCVSYQGSMAYCTERCQTDASCRKGYSCVPVIQSDPGPNSNIGPNDRFCVKMETQFQCEK